MESTNEGGGGGGGVVQEKSKLLKCEGCGCSKTEEEAQKCSLCEWARGKTTVLCGDATCQRVHWNGGHNLECSRALIEKIVTDDAFSFTDSEPFNTNIYLVVKQFFQRHHEDIHTMLALIKIIKERVNESIDPEGIDEDYKRGLIEKDQKLLLRIFKKLRTFVSLSEQGDEKNYEIFDYLNSDSVQEFMIYIIKNLVLENIFKEKLFTYVYNIFNNFKDKPTLKKLLLYSFLSNLIEKRLFKDGKIFDREIIARNEEDITKLLKINEKILKYLPNPLTTPNLNQQEDIISILQLRKHVLKFLGFLNLNETNISKSEIYLKEVLLLMKYIKTFNTVRKLKNLRQIPTNIIEMLKNKEMLARILFDQKKVEKDEEAFSLTVEIVEEGVNSFLSEDAPSSKEDEEFKEGIKNILLYSIGNVFKLQTKNSDLMFLRLATYVKSKGIFTEKEFFEFIGQIVKDMEEETKVPKSGGGGGGGGGEEPLMKLRSEDVAPDTMFVLDARQYGIDKGYVVNHKTIQSTVHDLRFLVDSNKSAAVKKFRELQSNLKNIRGIELLIYAVFDNILNNQEIPVYLYTKGEKTRIVAMFKGRKLIIGKVFTSVEQRTEYLHPILSTANDLVEKASKTKEKRKELIEGTFQELQKIIDRNSISDPSETVSWLQGIQVLLNLKVIKNDRENGIRYENVDEEFISTTGNGSSGGGGGGGGGKGGGGGGGGHKIIDLD